MMKMCRNPQPARWGALGLALLALTLALIPARPVAASPYTEGPKTCLVMIVDFSDKAGAPLTTAEAQNMINTCSGFWNENSYGSASMTATVTPLMRMPQTTAVYGTNDGQLLADARAAAKALGMDFVNFDRDVVCFPRIDALGYAGLAYVGARGAWLNGYFDFREAGHEFGHNYGLLHANYYRTTDGNPIGAGTSEEYGDPFDTMGGSGGSTAKHYNVWFKNRLDWIPGAGVKDVTASGIYRIQQHDNIASTALRALKIKKDGTHNYWIEFRQKFPGTPTLFNGAQIRWGYNGNHQSDLLDFTPTSKAGPDDSGLAIGRTYTDPALPVHITPLGKGGTNPETLDVMINFGDYPGNNAPVVSITPSATSVGIGANVDFTASATDADGDALAYYWEFGDGTFGPNAAATSHSWGAQADYVVTCTVSDMKGGVGIATVIIKVGNPSTFHISGRVFSGCGQVLSGVTVKADDAHTALSDTSGNYTLVNLAAGSYTLTATKPGYTLAPSGFTNPVAVGPDASNIDFSANSVDVGNPAVTIDSPANGATFTVPLTGISGTAQDNAGGSGLDRVDVAFIRNSDGLYWNGTTWVGVAAVLPTTVTGNAWTLTTGINLPSGTNLLDGSYSIKAIARDKSCNKAEALIKITFDRTGPTSVTFTKPLAGAKISSLPSVTGTAQDNTDGSGLDRVELTIQRKSDGLFWSGTAWAASATPLATTLTGTNWAAPTGAYVLPAGANLLLGDYKLTATAFDRAGNSASANITVHMIDRTAPTLRFTSPTAGAVIGSLARITGIAEDDPGGEGLAYVTLTIKRDRDGLSWNGTAWDSAVTQLPPTPGTAFIYEQGPAGANLTQGIYFLGATAADKVGNTRSISIKVTVDSGPPQLSFTNPVDGATISALPTVAGTAIDEGSGVKKVSLVLRRNSDGKWWSGTAWNTLVVNRTATLNGSNWSVLGNLPSGLDLTAGTYFLKATGTDNVGRVVDKGINITVGSTNVMAAFTAPLNNAVQNALTQVKGTVNGAAAKVEVTIKRFDARYWNGTGWATSQVLRPATLTGSNWTLSSALPAGQLLPNGTYQLAAYTTDTLSRRTVTTINIRIDSTATGGGTGGGTGSVSSIDATVADSHVRLTFSAALTASTAIDATHYTVTVNGTAAHIEGAFYSTTSNTVLLELTFGTLHAGDQVVVAYHDLKDASGKALTNGQAGPATAH